MSTLHTGERVAHGELELGLGHPLVERNQGASVDERHELDAWQAGKAFVGLTTITARLPKVASSTPGCPRRAPVEK